MVVAVVVVVVVAVVVMMTVVVMGLAVLRVGEPNRQVFLLVHHKLTGAVATSRALGMFGKPVSDVTHVSSMATQETGNTQP